MQHLSSKFDSNEKYQKAGFEKVNDTLSDHIQILEKVQKGMKTQAKRIEDNKSLVTDKIGEFEARVLKELKESTKHFSFKAYE